CAIDLEFLYRFLANGGANTTAAIVGLTTVHGDVVAAPIASVKRQTAVRRLLHSEAVGVSLRLRIRNPGGEQGERKVIAAIDRQVRDGRVVDRIRLLRSLALDQRQLDRDLHDLAALADRELEIDPGDFSYRQLDPFLGLNHKPRFFHFDL